MTSTVFSSGTVITAPWLNDVNTKTYADTSNTVAYQPAGTGAVATTVQAKLRQYVSVKDFGAVGDGVTNDQPAIQAAIDSLIKSINVSFNGTISAKSGVLYFPSGSYKITTPLSLATAYGVIFEGDGIGSTSIAWSTNDNTASVINFSDCAFCQIRQMSIIANQPAHELVRIYNNVATTTVTSTSNTLQDVELNGNFNVYSCVLVGGGADANNDFMQFIRVSFMGYSHSGAFLQGFQSHQNHFFDCNFIGINAAQTAQNGLYGVYSQIQSPSNSCASFIFERGSCGWHAGADFFVGGYTSLGCQIYYGDSENSYRFFENGTVASSNTSVQIIGCRIESGKMASDRKIIINNTQGPLLINGCTIGTGGSPIQVQPYIFLNSSVQNVATITNNSFVYSNAASGDSSYTSSSVVVSALAGYDYAQITFANNSFINPIKTTAANFFQSTGQTTIPVYFGYGPYNVVNSTTTNISTLTPAYPFQKIMIYVNDAFTTFVTGGNIKFQNKTMPYTPGTTKQFELVYNSAFGFWTEATTE